MYNLTHDVSCNKFTQGRLTTPRDRYQVYISSQDIYSPVGSRRVVGIIIKLCIVGKHRLKVGNPCAKALASVLILNNEEALILPQAK